MMAAAFPNQRTGAARGLIAALCAVLLLSGVCPLLAADRSRPDPMVFIGGLHGDGAVDAIRAINAEGRALNTVYYELPLDAPDRLDAIRSHIAEAAAANLKVVIGLPTRLDNQHRISARNPDYEAAASAWLSEVVGGLCDSEGVSAWATDHSLERDLSHTDEDFRQFLLERYGSLEAINASWNAEFRSLRQITRESADEHDFEQTHGVGRPSVDLAEYQRGAFHDVMALWALEIRRLDAETPLMTGRISLYRSLTAIPDSYDIVQPHFPPDVLEPDIVTHNVQGVQMARMAGKFDVIPWFRVPLPPSEAYSRGAVYSWVLEAGLRGAVGVGLESWERTAGAAAWRNNTLTNLRAALAQGAFAGDLPQPTAAVVHQPYAGGHIFFDQPAWGYVKDFPVRDFAELACNYRLGSIFGGLDYMTMDQLAGADLGAYSVVFLPTCLSIPPAAVSALKTYAEAGGVVFGDLGAGMYQSQSWAPTFSPLAVLFGITAATDPAHRFGTFRVGERHPAFPSLRTGMAAQGTFVPGEGVSQSAGRVRGDTFEGPATELKSYAFKGPSWFVALSSGAVPLATQSVRYDPDEEGEEKAPHFLGPTVNSVGAGLGVFLPFAAWSWWPPEDSLHAAMHGDLLARRARWRLLSGLLVDPTVGISGSDDWLHLRRRGGEGPVEVLAGEADHRAYLGSTGTFSAAERTPEGRRSGVVRLTVDLSAGTMRHCEAIPVRLRPATGECRARVSAYAPGLIMLEVGGNSSVWGKPGRGQSERFNGGAPTRIRFSIDDGLYPVEPGSEHQVSISEGRERSNAFNVTADHRGRLDFWLTTPGGRLEIAPSRE